MYEKLIAGESHELHGFILLNEHGYVTWAQSEMADFGYSVVTPLTVSFTVPSGFNAVAAEIASIESKIDKLSNDYHGQVATLKNRIQNLLAISYDEVTE